MNHADTDEAVVIFPVSPVVHIRETPHRLNSQE
jgi:hypothetical protein